MGDQNEPSETPLVGEASSLLKLNKNELVAVIQEQLENRRRFKKLDIPLYKGYNEVIGASEWINLYEEFAEDDRWSDDRKLKQICGYLRELALEWYFSHVRGSVLQWGRIKELFIEQFGVDDRPDINRILDKYWDSDKESLNQYYQHKVLQCRKAGISGPIVLQLLTRGLPEKMKNWAITLNQSSTPQEWFSIVSNAYSNSHEDRKHRHLSRPTINNIEYEKVKQQFSQVSAKPPIDLNEEVTIKCTHCGKDNHTVDRCFKLHGYPKKRKKLVKNEDTQQLNVMNSDHTPDSLLTPLIQEGELQVNWIDQHDQLDYADIQINHRITVLALIDSGASVSAIDESFCIKNCIPYYKESRSLKGATSIFQTKGTAHLQVKIGTISHNISAVVIPLVSQAFSLGRNYFSLFNYHLSGPSLVKASTDNAKTLNTGEMNQVMFKEEDQIPTINVMENILQNSQLEALNRKYDHVFGVTDFDVGSCDMIECYIHLKPGTKPINSKPRRLSLPNQLEEREQIDMLLKAGLIRHSFSNWASGITFAITPGKRPRLCGDYRYLNQHTIDDKYPIPLIDNIILSLQGASVYSTLDVVRGYNHIGIHEDHKFKTAFITNVGLFEWNRLPFGLKNAPALFQRMMDLILKEQSSFARVYFDDVLIFSKNEQDHVKHLELVYKQIEFYRLKINRQKCRFLAKEVKFCGFIIGQGTRRRDSKFIEAIKNIKRPTNSTELQQFLGLANYGRSFVCNFAGIVRPLNLLRKKNVPWSWDKEHDIAFFELKRMLILAPGTHLFDPSWGSTVLFCDASRHTIAAVLLQSKENTERIIGYFSRTLSETQLKYNIYNKEFLAVIKAVEFFRQYLHGHHFKIVTDNSALAYFKTSKEILDKHARWMIFLEEFSFDIEHRAGVLNRYADALTRLAYENNNEAVKDSCNTLIAANMPRVSLFIAKLIDKEATSEPQLVPSEYLEDVLNYFHKEKHNHIGRNKMIKELKVYCRIPSLHKTVKRYLSQCKACVQINQKNVTRGYCKPSNPIGVNQRWFVDIMGPLPPSKDANKYTFIITIIDHTSRYGQAYAKTSINTDSVINTFKTAFCEYGKPLEIYTDNGPSFVSWRFRDMLRKCDIKQKVTPAYHQSSNGLIERFNKTFHEALAKYSAEGLDWASQLHKVIRNYNRTIHRVTNCRPIDLINGTKDPVKAIENTCKQQRYDASRINTKRKSCAFNIGDNIMIETPKELQRKLKPKRTGPYKITEKVNDEIFKTDRPAPGHTTNIHVHAGNIERCDYS